jgi:hypothetical protein
MAIMDLFFPPKPVARPTPAAAAATVTPKGRKDASSGRKPSLSRP